MNPQNNSRSRKLLIIIIAIIVLIGLVSFFVIRNKQSSPINDLYTNIKNGDGLTPEQLVVMNLVAKDRSVSNVDTSSFKYTEALGYKFKTPWGAGTITEQTIKSSSIKQIEYKNGKKVILLCANMSPREEFTVTDSNLETPLPKEDTDQILKFLGTKADSGFEYMNYLLSINIESIKEANDLNSAEAVYKLLTLKSVTLSSDKQPYRFKVGSLNGFQWGDYSQPQSTRISIYPNEKINCAIMSAESHGLTQKDADVIISTFGSL